MRAPWAPLWGIAALLAVLALVEAEILTPPYFNLAERKRIKATATCGDEGPEQYCKLVGANTENNPNIDIIQGQVCDYCDMKNVTKNHPPEYAVDGMETWWQSPPLSRGMKYNEINLTIDLGQEFHVAYVFVRMGNSPRPGIWALEKSSDYGKTFTPWQYFASSQKECELYFGTESLLPITKDDSVICSTEYSKIVPLEGGEIAISLVNNRPSANTYFNSSVLQEWTRATNVSLRLLGTKTLYGHLMSVARQDPTVTRRYFYSIKDISIGGRCMCNGHAETCDIPDLVDPNKLNCRCQHHTCGPQCERCCSGFEQKAWRQSQNWKRFVCEPCNCFNHSNECHYDSDVDAKGLSLDIHGKYDGGGVCDNCQHNTEGINCNKCKPKFYKPYGKHWDEIDVCQACNCNNRFSTGNCAENTGQCECKIEYTKPNCDSCSYGYFGFPECKPCTCHLNGTVRGHCEPLDGACPCKSNYAGFYCEQCSEGFYKFPDCEVCDCNPIGSLGMACDQISGNCTCKNNYGGRTCDQCEVGFYEYPTCKYCNCDATGTLPTVCDSQTGKCFCKEGFGGARCDQCLAGYYSELRQRERACVECKCSTVGSTTTSCDGTGKCSCLYNFAGKQCNQCSPGYYKYPECLACNCDSQGAIGVTCDLDGQCQCKGNFDGLQCQVCKEGFYNFPACEECNCDPKGIIQHFAGCGSVPEGELCQCKDRVQGKICDECKPLYWNLQQYNPQGCQDCECYTPGTQGGIATCKMDSGQCACKHSVTKRNCKECKDGSYNLTESNFFGCTDCGCDIGGSVDHNCDKESGHCLCKPKITGKRCDKPLKTYYFPTLHEIKFEGEDSFTPEGNDVRYGFDEATFPEFSSKGYAILSFLQKEINQNVNIRKSSVYRMVMRYVNPNTFAVTGKITVKPENPNEIEQQATVVFKPTKSPQFVTVSGIQGITPSPLVMNPGNWVVDIKIDKTLFLDYFAFLPAAYYEGTALTRKVENICVIGDKGLCKHFGYPNIAQFNTVHGAGGFVSNNGERSSVMKYLNKEQLRELTEQEMPLLDGTQEEILLDMMVNKIDSYVLLLEYVTPIDQQGVSSIITVTARGSASKESSKASLNNCPYTSVCRQVLLDEMNRVQIFKVQDNNVGLSLKRQSGGVAIKSVVAIPLDKWHMDFIKPEPICIRKNGKCLQSEFPLAPDSKKVEFESGLTPSSEIKPWNIFDNNTDLVYLNPEAKEVDVTDVKVPFAGQFVIIVQYYQPDFPASNLEVVLHNGQFYEAILPIKHCPSNSGCRSTIETKDGIKTFSLTEQFWLTVKEISGSHVWLDYFLIVPADRFTENLLTENKLDQTREFISTCGNNHFYVNITEKGFCRDAIFSLTTDYNNGALPCRCILDASLSFECEAFGGQCECKPNVIGRRCEACKTGYYGFPDCKPCDCPSSASCEKDTGECICPTRVTGERCDRCMPYSYSFDQIFGCLDCNCNQYGVENNQLQCDLYNGTCECKKNVVGRTCDHCTPGHYDFPYCYECECDTRGTTEDICDEENAWCYCKSNVIGNACDTCKDGTFDLQESNEAGCTKCFCFGKTTRCDSAKLYWAQITGLEDWSVVNIRISENYTLSLEKHTKPPQNVNATVLGADLTDEEAVSKIVYFEVSQDYLGNRLTSYGGYLEYEIFYTIGVFGNAVSAADVIFHGANNYLVHSGIEQPPVNELWSKKLQIVESEFRTLAGIAATRELLMTVLQDLQGIYIRATYWEPSVFARITAVSLEAGIEQYIEGSVLSSSIEECNCPANYKGRSCEECAEGYYRVQSGPHGGYCVPCQCNGHASSCDVNTGICHNCKHNTKGDYCEQCIEGYHGNATLGKPNDCLICACPLPIPSNNFATSCNVSLDGESIMCNCKPEYFGARCESCNSGFYGRPELEGDFCKPCQCSGNIDPNDPSSCDTITGDCLKCMNNTFGAACAICQPGYFGDAIVLKDCQACLCDKDGMDRCDSSTGICECKTGVIGDKCDRCRDEHWGFESGNGCSPCNCAEASDSKQCDDNTGQCKCRHGVTGKTCDQCAPGFWKYSPNGCIKCGCNTAYSFGLGCNSTTGHCECLPGVIGEKCDHCPYRNVLISDQGCFACDSCVHDLLDSTDELHRIIDAVTTDFHNKTAGFFTAQRLVYLSEKAAEYADYVDKIVPDNNNLKKFTEKIDVLENDAKNLDRKAEYDSSDAQRTRKLAGEFLAECQEALIEMKQTNIKSNQTVNRVWSLANSLDTAESLKLENAIAEANQTLSDIRAKSLEAQRNASEIQRENAMKLLNTTTEFLEPVNLQSEKYEVLRTRLNGLRDKLIDLQNYTRTSQLKADEADKLNMKNKANKVNEKIQNVNMEKTKAENDSKETVELLKKSKADLDEIINGISISNDKLNEAFNLNDHVGNTIKEREADWPDLVDLVDKAIAHTNELKEKSANLTVLFELAKNNTQFKEALRGVSAYPNIVKKIGNATSSTQETVDATTKAKDKYKDIEEQAIPSKVASNRLYQESTKALRDVQGELKPQLEIAEKAVDNLRNLTNTSDSANNAIVLSLQDISKTVLDPETKKAFQKADQINQTINDVNSIMNNVLKSLPTSLEQAQKLPKDVHEITKSNNLIKNQLETVEQIKPNISTLQLVVESKQKRLDIVKIDAESQLEKLRKAIAMAKELANRIKVGVQVEQTTTLELEPPDNLDELGTSTRVSTYFKTPKENGFLMYLGNPEGTNLRRTKRDDFMALEVENGYPVLTIDIGGGPQRIINKKYVANDVWYQVIVERMGKNVKLIIREEVEKIQDGRKVLDEKLHEVESVLPGTNTIFNLDKDQSKLFVGGYPSTHKIQGDVRFSSFEGQIEDLVIGDKQVGLWNFANAQGNRYGAKERNKLVNIQPSKGYRFNGSGYAIIEAENTKMSISSEVELKFKTFAKEGLIFLAGKGRSFFSVEINDGRAFMKFRLNGDTLTIGSTERYNDGRWHTLVATRYKNQGRLNVDDVTIGQKEVASDGKDLEITKHLYFGGYPDEHGFDEVTNAGFDGCIDDVIISTRPVDLSQNYQAFGVSSGCPDKFASLVSFEPGKNGYVNRPKFSVANDFQMSFKLRTASKNGLIFYATDAEQSAGISLSLLNGSLVAISQKKRLSTGPSTYNDDQWHVVTVTHDKEALTISVDDNDDDYFSTDESPPTLQINDGNAYIGGVPKSYVITPGGSATKEPFIGCLAEATLNGVTINFANITDKYGETMGKCFRDAIPISPSAPSYHVPLIPDEDSSTKDRETQQPTAEIPIDRETDTHTTESKKMNTMKPTETSSVKYVPERHLPKPHYNPGCSLSSNPIVTDDDPALGYRFGLKNNSRIEFQQLPARYKKNFDFSVELNTIDEDGGLIFYAADKSHKDFIAVYMRDGRIHFTFDCGSGPAKLVTEEKFNDGEWHMVEFSRDLKVGKLVIDTNITVTGESTGNSDSLIMEGPFYYGGLEHATVDIKFNLEEHYSPFKGCLKNLKMSNRLVAIVKNVTPQVNVVSCNQQSEEPGTFFRGHGYLKVKLVNIGKKVEFSLYIKPRDPTGLLLYIHGKTNYFILELVDNTIVATANNGAGAFETTYTPSNSMICDGNWHNITVIKEYNIITLGLNGSFNEPTMGPSKATKTKTQSPLYIGGHPKVSTLKVSKSRKQFTGCIKNVVYALATDHQTKVNVDLNDVYGDALVGMCPTN